MNNRRASTRLTRSGFTLIEFLIAISIIAILATLATTSLMKSRTQACDATRLADIKQIQSALEMFYYDSGSYPKDLVFGAALVSLTGKTFMQKVPQAPSFCVYGNACPLPENKNFQYLSSNMNRYRLNYCLDTVVNGVEPGPKFARQGILMGSVNTNYIQGDGFASLVCTADDDCAGTGTCQAGVCQCGPTPHDRNNPPCTASTQFCNPTTFTCTAYNFTAYE